MNDTVAMPSGADPGRVDEWQVDKTGEYPTYRCIWSTPLSTDPDPRVVAVQLADGSICLDEGDKPAVFFEQQDMLPTDARTLAAALSAAADLAESWAGAAVVSP